MRVACRVDASRRIGTGHVMRCLALAARLRERGADVHFIGRRLDGNFNDTIRAQGFTLHELPAPAGPGAAGNGTAHADWLEVAAGTDAAETRAVLERVGGVDWLVVDHFALEAGWERELRGVARGLFVIDDLADRAHDADLLLDPVAEPAERYRPLLPEGAGTLLGPRYTLLRAEFAARHAQARPRSGEVRRLFVSFGGVDLTGETAKAVEALRRLADLRLEADVVVGAGNRDAAALRRACETLAGAQFHVATPDVASLMQRCDLALGAGGVMAWERACLGVPSVVLVTAPNQRGGAHALADAGAAVAFEAADVTAEALAGQVQALCGAPERIRAMSARALDMVDGRGAERAARRLLPPRIELRAAVESDREALFRWRNDENVRRFSHSAEPIAREAHDRWFAGVLADPARHLLIAQHAGRPVGVLRYDLAGDAARVSIYLVPGESGHGFGPAILGAGRDWLARRCPGVRQAHAEVQPANHASRRAFEEAGYARDGSVYRQRVAP